MKLENASSTDCRARDLGLKGSGFSVLPEGRRWGRGGSAQETLAGCLQDLLAETARVVDELLQALLAVLSIARKLVQHLLQLPLHRHALVHGGLGRQRGGRCQRHARDLAGALTLSLHLSMAQTCFGLLCGACRGRVEPRAAPSDSLRGGDWWSRALSGNKPLV
ncbi:hypothetical protein NDU88_009235 [Pleurodeles waltl]|uniref:Uncharacterized protein n=1 Tax=Pleurodeles waltl TaxID=8319 RepID=A0AAV7NYN3_PLEWA|nr:hypothetical protein NDU88_009235 [Pleurodeles waltl]